MRRSLVGSQLVVIAALAGAAPAQAAQDAIASGRRVGVAERRVHVYAAVGQVSLRRGTGGEFGLTATARGADGGELRFELDRAGDSAVFRVVFPDVDAIASPNGERGGGRTTLRLRRDGTFGGDDGNRWFGGRRGRGAEVDIGGRSGFRGWAEVEITVPDGRELTVHLAAGHATADGVTGEVMVDTWAASASATNIAGRWVFDTGSGDVEVRGAQGSLRCDTGSGACTIAGMRGDLLDLDTGSGSVEATDVEVDRFRFDTGSGDVRARNLRARRGVADTGSGAVDLDYTGAAIEDLLIDTGSGRVNLRLPPGADARVTVDTGSGGIEVQRAGAVFERRGEDGVVLRFGEGRGRVRIDTGSGGVTIR